MGENIGFTARSMGNFGFSELRIVNPRDGWPNKAAEATAVKSVEIIKNAKVFDSFHQAVEDLEFIYATSARSRDLNKEHISSKEIKNDVKEQNVQLNKIGILFGAERSGLDNDVISYANKIVYIPTDPNSKSINIAISSALLCYELSDISQGKINRVQDLADQKDITNFLSHLEKMLDVTNFYRTPEKKEKMLYNIRNIFKRINHLTYNEVSTLIGIIKSLFDYRK
ncbi:MAG: RNA methyltransferase [Alphaproteobacteria bacterium]|nr:RNA methyltransferase [Alphaproteobacteria bacterium]